MPLKASQRVTLLKEIGQRLGVEEWPLVDVTLSQFGLPTSDQWSGDKTSYVLQMSKGATDPVLIELAQHVGFVFQEEPPKQGIDPPFWRKGMLRVFLSHLSAHRAIAAQLQRG